MSFGYFCGTCVRSAPATVVVDSCLSVLTIFPKAYLKTVYWYEETTYKKNNMNTERIKIIRTKLANTVQDNNSVAVVMAYRSHFLFLFSWCKLKCVVNIE